MEDMGLPRHQLDIGSMREPRWPLFCLGSITHSKGVAAAIVLPRRGSSGVGLDIEEMVSFEMLNEVKASVVQPDEWHALSAGVPHARQGVLCAAVFSAKESFFKAACAQVGRYFDLHAVEALASRVDEGWINLRVREHLSARFRAGSIRPIAVRPVSDETLMTLARLPAACVAKQFRAVPRFWKADGHRSGLRRGSKGTAATLRCGHCRRRRRDGG